MSSSLLSVINEVRANKGHPPLDALGASLRWREDIGFDSLDLAELTVRIEEKFDVDVFADGVVTTVGEVGQKIEKAGRL
jgi:acyl carrier protein